MPMIRVNALRSLRFAGARATARSSASRTQIVAKRFASSGGSHGHAESGSDLPWLLGAIAVTPPACWYLWPDTSHAEHGDHGHHEEHAAEESEEKPTEDDQSSEDEAPQEDSAPAEQADEPEKTEEKAQQSSEKPEDKSGGDDEKSDNKSEGKSEGGDDKQEGGEEEPEDDSGSSEQGQDEKSQEGKSNNFGKGKMHADSEGHNAVHKSEPNPASRGTGKRRIDSGLGRNIGEGDESSATAKPTPKNSGDMANKQAGMSNTDTRHSHTDEELAPLSSKGSGQLDTAKAKGTVDPSAPAKGPGGAGKAAEKKPTGEDN